MKKRGMSARIGAIILAASMVVGDAAPTLAAQQANVDEDAVVFAEFVETTENSETEEVSETTEVVGTSETSEAEEVSETTDTELKAAEQVSVTTPGKVAHLRFETEAQNGEIDQSILSWDADQNAEGYEIHVVDGNGVEYAEGTRSYTDATGEVKSGLQYYVSGDTSEDLDELKPSDYYSSKLLGYKLENGSYVSAKDSEGKTLEIKNNTAYTIQVRAYNENGGAYAFGEWSDPITYNFPTMQYQAEKVTGIVVNSENGNTSIVYQKGKNETVEMEIKDASGREYFNDADVKDGSLIGIYYSENSENGNTIYPENIYSSLYNSAYLYEVKEGNSYATRVKDEKGADIKAFAAGQSYTVRLRGVVGSGDSKTVSDWSEPVTVTVQENSVPQVTGQLEYNIASKSVSWNPVKNVSGYEVELKDAAGNWYNDYDNDNETGKAVLKNFDVEPYETSLYVSDKPAYELNADGMVVTKTENGETIRSGKPGVTYTVRVRAYNYKNGSNEKQYSEWSEALNFAVPAVTVPEKVTGVKVNTTNNDVSWNETAETATSAVTSYQVEVKDASNRLYIKTAQVYDPASQKYVYNYENYLTVNGTSTSVSNLQTYVEKDGKPVAVINTKTGAALHAMEQGQTYTIRVRAGRTLDGQTVPTYGEWSDVYTYTVPVRMISTGINAKPAQVTGLWIQTATKDNQPISAPKMYWNEIENVDRYEIEIKDSQGNSYSLPFDRYNKEKHRNYYSVELPEDADLDEKLESEVNVYDLSVLSAYTETGDLVYDQNGNPLKLFNNNETYTIRVRAVNRYTEYDPVTQKEKAAVEYQGDWSEAVTFKSAGNVAALTNFKLVREDEKYYYFSYDFNVANFRGDVYYQIATDANFTDASLVEDWQQVKFYDENEDEDEDNRDGYKLKIKKSSSNLKPSATYYVRVVASSYGMPYTSMEKSRYAEIMATATITSFTTNAQKTPKNITGLKIYSEDKYGYTLRFDAVLDKKNEDGYEIQIANDANSSNWSKISSYDADDYEEDENPECTVDKCQLPEGNSYIRAVAYVKVYNEATQKTEKVYGQPSNVITITKDTATTSEIGKIALAEQNDNSYWFSYTGKLRLDEDVELWYSDSKNFETNKKDVQTEKKEYSVDSNKKVALHKEDLTPGKTYYVKMRTCNSKAKTDEKKYSAFSNVVKVKVSVPEIEVGCSYVTKDSITLTMKQPTQVTGYEIQKKSVNGKKTVWTTLAQTSSPSYTDKKLKADTTYSYRVRPYFFNTDTNKTSKGTWVYCEAMTGWGGNMKLQAAAASKTSVKLSWSKISGTKGYEIYRSVTKSSATEISNGEGNGYEKYKMIADLSSGKKSYTDKGLTSGMSYSYKVKAYKMVDNKKVYIEDQAVVSLGFELTNFKYVRKSNGKVTVTWNPVYTAKGYLVEKKDNASEKWSKYKTIKKVKTNSITLPATKDTDGVTYRISAYNGTKYTDKEPVTVYPVLAAPTKVTAKATKDGIKVSWKKVSGADYYRVYRTTDKNGTYNKDTKSYSYNDATEIGTYVADSSKVSGYRQATPNDMNVTSVVDRKITYSVNGVNDIVLADGPETGVTYYYVVVAYKKLASTDGYVYDNDDAGYYNTSYGNYNYALGCSKAASATFNETKPAATSISKITSKSKKVTLKYKASKEADGYEIERSTSKKKGFEVIKDVNNAKTLTYVDKNSKSNVLKKGKTYYYRVRAYKYNDDGSKVYAKYSKVKSVKVK